MYALSRAGKTGGILKEKVTPPEINLGDLSGDGKPYSITQLPAPQEPIVNRVGNPYRTAADAQSIMENKGLADTHEVIPYESGFALQRKGAQSLVQDLFDPLGLNKKLVTTEETSTPANTQSAPSAESTTFIKNANNSIDLGFIHEDIGKQINRQTAPIRLERGDENYGEIHIDNKHGDEIRDAGYPDVKSMVNDVAANYSDIYEGRKGTLLLAKKNGKIKVAFVELKPADTGDYYSVGSAFISRSDFLKNKKKLWEGAQTLHSPEETPSAVTGQSVKNGTEFDYNITSAEDSVNNNSLGIQDKTIGFTPEVNEAAHIKQALADGKSIKPEDLKNYPDVANGINNEFVNLNGSSDLGFIDGNIEKQVGIPSAPIRMQIGNNDYGGIHIANAKGGRRLQDIKDAGYSGVNNFVGDVAKNYNQIWQQPNGRLMLVKRNGNAKVAVVELADNNDHYGVVTALMADKGYPARGGRELLWERSEPISASPEKSTPLTNTAFNQPSQVGDAWRSGQSVDNNIATEGGNVNKNGLANSEKGTLYKQQTIDGSAVPGSNFKEGIGRLNTQTAPSMPGIRTKEPLRLPPDELSLSHRTIIEKALSENKPVPAEVLKDYPDLAIEHGKSIIDQMIKDHTDKPAAMYRDDVGTIEFPWGKEGNPKKKYSDGNGISHIIAKRNSEGLNGEEIARMMPEVIVKGEIGDVYGPRQGQRVNIKYGDHEAVLSLYKKGKEETWLLTGWKEKTPGVPEESNNLQDYAHQTSGSRSDVGAGVDNNLAPTNDSVNSKHNKEGKNSRQGKNCASWKN